ncbi:mitochondrial ribosomal protein L19 precursor, putative [Plasmodium ovale wallikeri]|uniref:50S ribosomal protein L19, chloroplastic n=1 Tax=Plasmodium ovale wallikeri TaxID=864142 RepID=A0A1A8Z6K0_PLAOA|nr:mitochondrial ribosomal protein L19 precursor, putative [Plasmodium ovale wallikeri]
MLPFTKFYLLGSTPNNGANKGEGKKKKKKKKEEYLTISVFFQAYFFQRGAVRVKLRIRCPTSVQSLATPFARHENTLFCVTYLMPDHFLKKHGNNAALKFYFENLLAADIENSIGKSTNAKGGKHKVIVSHEFTSNIKRYLRTKVVTSLSKYKWYNIDNEKTSKMWPNIDCLNKEDENIVKTSEKEKKIKKTIPYYKNYIYDFLNRQVMHNLHLAEIKKMNNLRNFKMPKIHAGDLIEVKYELSRSQQTFAIFQGRVFSSSEVSWHLAYISPRVYTLCMCGVLCVNKLVCAHTNFSPSPFTGYCVEIRKKRLDSSFIVKNVFDGVGVEQLIPFYSPRILYVKIVKSLHNVNEENMKRYYKINKPITRDYRYMWQYNVRGKYERPRGQHKPGIRSIEPKIRRRLAKLKKKYMQRRIESNLSSYIFGGIYAQYTRKRTRLIRAEIYRRMLIYALDEENRRKQKLNKRREKEKWGTFKINRSRGDNAFMALPSNHPLAPGRRGLA